MFRFLFSTLTILAVFFGFIYFAPAGVKTKIWRGAEKFLPQSLTTQAENLLKTPIEARAELIKKLTANLEALKQSPAGAAEGQLISDSEKALQDLAIKNESLSLTELIKSKAVDLFLPKKETKECK